MFGGVNIDEVNAIVNALPLMSSQTQDRVSSLFTLNKFKLFSNDGDFVACYGKPAMAEDGWIINLPAENVFKDDYHCLPFEVELQATWVHAQSTVNQSLARYISVAPSSTSWSSKAAAIASELGVSIYGIPDLFRDISSILIAESQPVLALPFIKTAHQLRPNGPAILKLMKNVEKRAAQLES